MLVNSLNGQTLIERGRHRRSSDFQTPLGLLSSLSGCRSDADAGGGSGGWGGGAGTLHAVLYCAPTAAHRSSLGAPGDFQRGFCVCESLRFMWLPSR